MNSEFERCLKRNKIREFSRGRFLVKKELKTAKSDLERARSSFTDKDYKWATIQCYFSMFHSARSLLYAKGYREKSHHCLIIAMRALYAEKKLLSIYLV